jgi:Predicted Zn-dependent hydrolases of the beta-lactamase fold
MPHKLKTIGHATQILFEDGVPLIATDPWLIGSTYWRSWWLEKYPTMEEIDEVRRAKFLYITHSHPDHFHYPTLRVLGKRTTLHPQFPRYEVAGFLESNGFPAQILEPWRWYSLTKAVRIASIPTPIDDSILIISTPNALTVNLNDSVPRANLLRLIRKEMLFEQKPIIMLKSYSPASMSASIYREGRQTQMKTKMAYAETAAQLANTLGASYFVPFASQAFFNRSDSKWANAFKVTYEDLKADWTGTDAILCKPFVDMDLDTFSVSTGYSNIRRCLDVNMLQKVTIREREEEEFVLPNDAGSRLRKYMDEIYFLTLFFRKGIGWRLNTSNSEFFYDSRSGQLAETIPRDYDVVIELPDKVFYESLEKNVLTELGISMFIKVDSKVSNKFTYGLFLLMGIHDYGHFDSRRDFIKFFRFYLPYLIPQLLRLKWWTTKRPSKFPPIRYWVD